MSPLTRLTNIQLSLIHVNPLSDVPILDTLMSFAYVRRHASFPLASHLAVSSNAVRVGYAVVRFNRVRIELTFYHYSLKRTHNLGLEGGLNFRWQYRSNVTPFKASFFYLVVAIAFIFVMLWYTSKTIKIFSALFSSYLIFVSAVHLITNDSDNYQREASVWVNGMLGLITITGVLTLAIDYSNTKPLLKPMVLGFAGVGFRDSLDDGVAKGVGRRKLVIRLFYLIYLSLTSLGGTTTISTCCSPPSHRGRGIRRLGWEI